MISSQHSTTEPPGYSWSRYDDDKDDDDDKDKDDVADDYYMMII